jgi:hypothetical protein
VKLLTATLGLLLVGSNAWWMYQSIDRGVTDTYREQERYETANRVVALSTLAGEAVTGKPKAEVVALLKRLFPEHEPFEKDGSLHTLWVSLPLSATGLVTGVELEEGMKSVARPVPAAKR